MIRKLLRIGFTASTTKAEKEYHVFIIMMGLLMSAGAFLWALLAAVCDLKALAALALLYPVLTLINFFQFKFSKQFSLTRFIQVFISLLLPFAFQWTLGGFAASGMMMIWAVISLTGAMTYKTVPSIVWLVFFTLLIVFSGLTDGQFQSETLVLPASLTTLFFAFNMAILSIITFTLFFGTKLKLEFAVNKENLRKQELEESRAKLQQAHNEVLSSEEEIRQNAEELKAINEHLETIQQDLETALDKEQTGRLALEQAHSSLKSAQAGLLQSEKMASLGQMTAGVAHEINNPMNFVSGGVQTLKEVMNDLLHFVDACEQLMGSDTIALQDQIKELVKLKDQLILEELKEDSISLLGDIELGASRATEIVKGLRNFSRLDQDVFKKGDVHEGLASTLLILRHRFQKVKLHKEYAENLPLIDCNMGQLNQVFTNLIGNALDAMESKGTLTISTQELPNHVEIRIKDTGTGMPEEVTEHIFEPFFTTKEVGKGTGLGLSISYGIIQKHQGELRVESELNVGTTFIISLPKE